MSSSLLNVGASIVFVFLYILVIRVFIRIYTIYDDTAPKLDKNKFLYGLSFDDLLTYICTFTMGVLIIALLFTVFDMFGGFLINMIKGVINNV